jgi:DNA-binding transcriptional MerR regulator
MQLDLLQEGLFPDRTANQLPPPKTSAKNRPVELYETPDFLEDIPLKPLPASIVPVLSARKSSVVDAPHDDNEKVEKSPDAFKTISEAATFLGVPQHVLRFWESRFAQIKPLKMAGGRRYYRPDDMEILSTIKHLLYKQGYTIKGAKKAFSSLKKSKASSSINTDILSQPIQTFPEIKPRVLSKKQLSQLSGIRQELMGLKETLGQLL